MARRAETTTRRTAVLDRARASIRRHHRDPDLSLEDVARDVGISPRQLQRVFREEGGETSSAYLLRVRMESALDLLTREVDPLPIRVVAARVGYRQASGLRQAFKRYYGRNPSTVQPAPPEYLGTLEVPDS